MPYQPSPDVAVPQFASVPGQQITLPVTAVPPGIAPANPMPSAVSGPRAAQSVPPVRLPPAARLEYEAYIQGRMRAMTQQGVAGVSAVGVPAQGTLHTTIAPGVMKFYFSGTVMYFFSDETRKCHDKCEEMMMS